jgi:hypothetical protein
LIEHADAGDLPPHELPDKFRFKRADSSLQIGHHQGEIAFSQHLIGFFDPELSELARIVEPRRIDEHNRPDRQKLHRFVNGVGRCSRNLGRNGDLLSRQGVDQRRFPGISSAENTNGKAARRRRFV